MLDRIGFGKEAEVELRDGEIVLQPMRKGREGWAEAFRKAAETNEDPLSNSSESWIRNEFDEQEWEW